MLESSAEAVPSPYSGDSRYYNVYELGMGTTDSVENSLFVTRADGTFIRMHPHALLFRTYVLPQSAPDAPADVTVVPGDGTATVSWTAPASNGGAITSYTATASTGEHCVTEATSCTIEGLTNGTEYTFTVTASNAFGISPASVQSAPVVPAPETSSPADSEPVTAITDPDNTEVAASGAPELAMTGADSGGTATLAALLLGGGLVMLLATRRRKQLS